ncbi:acetate/propionate family kinase [Candidatus Peregrinibacteria bacterium]|nr:MAG: acetate/propionate family kinase [Candidatus Peregrinibacteria bacterium]
MFILVLNAGSSSLRFCLFNKRLEKVYKGHVDAIGQKHCQFRHYLKTGEERMSLRARSHKAAIHFVLKMLLKEGWVHDLQDIKKVGHRVVHGGEKFIKPLKINAKNLKELAALSPLAPLHNPANLEALKVCLKALPKAVHTAVFDTAFHSTLPQKAFLYGLPYALYKKEHLRRYGFHGSSHKYVSGVAQKILKNPRAKLLTCHLGNGVSIATIENGKVLDTSMGFTPLEGPLMGTRSGTLDPGLVLDLVKKHGLKKTEDLLQKESGFKGLSQLGSDIRTLWAQPKHKGTLRTFDVFSYQMAKLLCGYFATLGGFPDAIVFTAGIGENAYYLRERILAYLKPFGLKLDNKANRANRTLISTSKSRIKVLVIPTEEELQIAQEL